MTGKNSNNDIRQAILEYEQHSGGSCKPEFDTQPLDHDQYQCMTDNGRSFIQCSGWQEPFDLSIEKRPPFLIFELSAELSPNIIDIRVGFMGIFILLVV